MAGCERLVVPGRGRGCRVGGRGEGEAWDEEGRRGGEEGYENEKEEGHSSREHREAWRGSVEVSKGGQQ